MKIVRLGYTETSLLFIFYIKNYKKYICNKDENENIKNLINWLYTTSGYYDKSIKGDYFNFDTYKCVNSIIYNEYMSKLLINLYDCDILQLNFHNFNENINNYKNDFVNHFNSKKVIYKINDNNMFEYMKDTLFNIIDNKNILIINSFSKLIKKQIETNINNLKNIYSNFPNINLIFEYTTPYTFFNNGIHNFILDTRESPIVPRF